VQELADAIYQAREQKPVEAYISDMGASAAYWLASQAETIGANDTAMVGSIGVYLVLWDESARAADLGFEVHVIKSAEHKGDAEPGTPITDAQIADFQRIVDDIADHFVDAVARGRGQSRERVDASHTGQVWLAREAQDRGLIDTITNLDAAIAASITSEENDMARKTAAAKAPEPEPEPVEATEINVEDATAAAIEAERARCTGIIAAFTDRPEHAAKAIEAGLTLEQAQAEELDGPDRYEQLAARLDALEARLDASVDAVQASVAENAKAIEAVTQGPEFQASDADGSTGAKAEPATYQEAMALALKEEGLEDTPANRSKLVGKVKSRWPSLK
jgi:signal peptide peptidase SppA